MTVFGKFPILFSRRDSRAVVIRSLIVGNLLLMSAGAYNWVDGRKTADFYFDLSQKYLTLYFKDHSDFVKEELDNCHKESDWAQYRSALGKLATIYPVPMTLVAWILMNWIRFGSIRFSQLRPEEIAPAHSRGAG